MGTDDSYIRARVCNRLKKSFIVRSCQCCLDFASQSMNGEIDVVIIGLYTYKKNCDWFWWNWSAINYKNWATEQPLFCDPHGGLWWAVAVTNPNGWLEWSNVAFRKWA